MSSNIDPRIDLYKTLGVSSDASAEDIKKAYRKLAKQYHPDITGGDKAKEARFKEISQAYDVLGDKDKRAQYDALRSGGYAGFPGADGFSGSGGFAGGFPGSAGFGDLGDLFAQMFQGAGGGGNVHVRYSQGGSPFEAEMPFGGQRRRRRTRPAPPAEQTVRAQDGSPLTQRGNDIYSDVRLSVDQAILGTVAEVPTLTGTARMKIPPGTSSGVKLRLKGKGAQAADGTVGDHYVTVQIDVPKNIDEEAQKLLVQFMRRAKKTV